MYKFLAITLLAASSSVQAYDCFPTPAALAPATGSPMRTVTTSYGYVKAWWCKLPLLQGQLADKEYWRIQLFPVHNSDVNITQFAQAAGRVATSADPVKQANIEIATQNQTYAVGSQKDYEYKMLRYLGCQDLLINPPVPNLDAPQPKDIPDWCGPLPVLPVSAGFVTIGTIAYKTTTTGLSGISGTITKGLACDCTSPLKIGTVTYCTFADAASPTIRASCAKP